jgi:phosphate transport system substrate-binding protein
LRHNLTAMTDADQALPLTNFLQLAAVSRRSFSLVVSTDHDDGKIYVNTGEVVHAVYADLVGDDALQAMLHASGVTYRQIPTTSIVRAPAPELRSRTPEPWSVAVRAQPPSAALSLPPPQSPKQPAIAAPRKPRRPALVVVFFALAVLGGVVVGWGVNVWPSVRRSYRSPDAERPAALAENLRAPAAGALDVAALGASDQRPQLLRGENPRRPNVELALNPTIVVRLLVGADGRVADARVYRSRVDLEAFEAAALDAAKAFVFSAARRNGAPVSVWMNWPVTFRDGSKNDTLRVKGSDTIGSAVGPELGRAFRHGTGIEVSFETEGSASAFSTLFERSSEIGASSRVISRAELAKARSLGLRLEEYVIGFDGVVIVVHPENPLRALTLEQASGLFSGRIQDWSQLTGGLRGAVRPLSRPSQSGTHVFFKQRILRKGNEAGPEEFAPRTHFLEKSEAIVEAVRADRAAIGYVGLAFVSDGIKALALSLGASQPAVEPSAEGIRDGSYPAYRPLLMYTNGTPRGATRDFLRFVLSPEGQGIIVRHHFVASEADVEALLPPLPPGDTEPAAQEPSSLLRASGSRSR